MREGGYERKAEKMLGKEGRKKERILGKKGTKDAGKRNKGCRERKERCLKGGKERFC